MTGKKSLLLVLVTLLLGSCGYKFTGGGEMPAGIRSVYVSIFDNRTFETGVENRFTNDLAYELTRKNRGVVLADREAADAVLSGIIRKIDSDAISHTSVSNSQEKRVTVVVDLVLKKRSGEVVWAASGLTEREEYAVESGDKLKTEWAKRSALTELSKRFAEKVYLGLTTKF